MQGYEVIVPAMPYADNPRIETWVNALSQVIQNPDERTYLVGHSIGCQTIMRYMEHLPTDTKIGGILFVAPFFNLPYLETEEEKRIAAPWLTTPIHYKQIKQHTKNITALFSDNDPDVPLSDKDLFKKNLGAKIIIEHAKGHFSDDAGVIELPSALAEILAMTR